MVGGKEVLIMAIDADGFVGIYPYLGRPRLQAVPEHPVDPDELSHAAEGECLVWDQAS